MIHSIRVYSVLPELSGPFIAAVREIQIWHGLCCPTQPGLIGTDLLRSKTRVGIFVAIDLMSSIFSAH